jgi:hypothetical protein
MGAEISRSVVGATRRVAPTMAYCHDSASAPRSSGRVEFHLDRRFARVIRRCTIRCGRAGARPSHDMAIDVSRGVVGEAARHDSLQREGRVPPRPPVCPRVPAVHDTLRTRGSASLPRHGYRRFAWGRRGGRPARFAPAGGSSSTSTAGFPRVPAVHDTLRTRGSASLPRRLHRRFVVGPFN